MKLPNDVATKIAEFQFDMDAFEAIVRDCATFVDGWEHLDPAVSYQLTEIAKALLARYHLEPKL